MASQEGRSHPGRRPELYQQLPDAVFPWTANRVELSWAETGVDVRMQHTPDARWPRPQTRPRLDGEPALQCLRAHA